MTTHPPNLFSISTGSSEPIYRQLIDEARRFVAAGQLKPGDLLPSVRDIAEALAVNPMTVSKAYNMLETEGLFERRRGIGMLVAEQRKTDRSIAKRLELLRPTLERAALEAQQLELEPELILNLFKQIIAKKS
jgi:GntR family transcriptional regulator